ncbi:MAG: DUF5680 domain-containing protein [Anaerolineae bacterium]
MEDAQLEQLHRFIVEAKAATYVGDGSRSAPYRPGAHELQYQQGTFSYVDSYFGGTDFVGQEVVYHEGQPVWAMNYYGHILRPEQITAAEAGQMIKESLSRMYAQGRFLGGFQHVAGELTYVDSSGGDLTSFIGHEWIVRGCERVYELMYHGGLIVE